MNSILFAEKKAPGYLYKLYLYLTLIPGLLPLCWSRISQIFQPEDLKLSGLEKQAESGPVLFFLYLNEAGLINRETRMSRFWKEQVSTEEIAKAFIADIAEVANRTFG